jgi:hypothetical protein
MIVQRTGRRCPVEIVEEDTIFVLTYLADWVEELPLAGADLHAEAAALLARLSGLDR